jgi:hypothetical protein
LKDDQQGKMTFDPLAATGLVLAGSSHDGSFRGTCFLFRQSTHAVTAWHVVMGLLPEQITIVLPRTLPLETHSVADLQRCPGTDLALIVLKGGGSNAEPFWDFVGNYELGEGLMAYGYPEDVLGPDQRQATPRLFRGYYQRYFHYHSHLGASYNAGEMSIAAPGGLSGGPVFRPGAFPMVTGVVTENLTSTTLLEAHEEQTMPGLTKRTEYQRVIQYGVSLLLDSHGPWLSEWVPPRRGR